MWFKAVYAPIFDRKHDQIDRIFFYATDITPQKQAQIEAENFRNAVSKSMAVMELDRDGNIHNANAVFADALGYSVEDLVRGRNHMSLCTPDHAESDTYRDFWRRRRIVQDFCDGIGSGFIATMAVDGIESVVVGWANSVVPG